jgi:HK97 family phage prohead protease
MKNNPPVSPNIEYKNFHFEIKAIDEDQGIIEGYLSTFGNVDYQNDRVQKGAFKKTLAEAKSRMSNQGKKYLWPVLWMHSPEQPIGGCVDAYEDDHGLYTKFQLDISRTGDVPNNPLAVMVFSGYKSGFIDEQSMGYEAIQKGFEGGIRDLKEVRVWEESCVTSLFAANNQAVATGVKSMENKTPIEDKEPEKPQRKDFADLYLATRAADVLEDWGDLINTLTQAMMQLLCMGDQPQQDMQECLDQFNKAVMEWVDAGMQWGLSEYISSRYGNDSSPYVPYSLRVGDDWGYMTRGSRPDGKVGARISSATKGTLEAHQADMKASLDAVGEHVKTMQQKMSDLTQLWQEENQGEAYGNDDNDGKSRLTRREPPSPALPRQGLQPLHKSTVEDDPIAEFFLS